MRTSHRQIRKRILDAKSKITDEEFFSSRAYNGYLTDLAEAATKRYKRPLRVRVVADHDDETVAFTDYHGIYINACNHITWSFPSRLLRSMSLEGLNAHECGHNLFTDERVWHSYFAGLAKGKFYPKMPDGLDSMQKLYAKDILEALTDDTDTVPMQVIMSTAHALSNILEDGYVDARYSYEFPGSPAKGIALNNLRYYDDDDRVELAEEAKSEDYSLLLISMPKIDQDTEFTPDRLQSALQDNDRTEWVFSRLEEQWKQKYYAVAVSPPEHGTGNLCPISFGKYKGKYSARWIDCAHCHFNVAQPPCCLCVAGAGIQKKEDFKRDLQDRLFDIDKIRRTNEEEIRLREERERSFERRSVYTRPTPYATRPVVPAGPTQEELDAEYIRICQSYDPSSEEWTVDRYNRRWIMCTVCGRIKQDAQMSYYGGKGGANRGVCADCSRNGRS